MINSKKYPHRLEIAFLFVGLYPNVKTLAQAFDKDPSQLINSQFNLTSTNRSIAGNLLKKIYTNTTFVDNLGAYVRVRLSGGTLIYSD